MRAAGVLLHPTALPGPNGIGELGDHAHAFADRLAAMGLRLWQVLPLGPTGFGDSPYQSFSSFAGNPLLISLDRLVDQGLLKKSELRGLRGRKQVYVDYGAVIQMRQAIFKKLSRHFAERSSGPLRAALADFHHEQRAWLDDYALFAVLKQSFGGRPWHQWPPALAMRETRALAEFRHKNTAAIEAVCLRQFLFFQQFHALRDHCHALGIELIGDLPIFVAHDSADVWAKRGLFQLNEDGQPSAVAGVPPDYFSETGQRWGNPLYDWEMHAKDDYAWWRQRLSKTLQMTDRVRIDHFRGFESYWAIPATEPTAVKGRWLPGPGNLLFESFRRAFGSPPIIAEDLGIITPEVHALRQRAGYPGMRVLQFCLEGGEPTGADHPENFAVNSVCYTGTHDNDTSLGWFRTKKGDERKKLLKFLGANGRLFHWDMMRACLASPSQTAVVPLQDILGLGSRTRFNQPGITAGNWRWRFRAHQIDEATSLHMHTLVAATGRLA